MSSKQDKREQARQEEAAAQGRGSLPADTAAAEKEQQQQKKKQQEGPGADRLPGETDEQRAQRRATQTDQPLQAQTSSTITSGLVEAQNTATAKADPNRGKEGSKNEEKRE